MPEINSATVFSTIGRIIKRPPEWVFILLFWIYLLDQSDVKIELKLLLSLLSIAATFTTGDFIRKNKYSWKRRYINSSDTRTRIKALDGKDIQDLRILKKALDDGGRRGLELVDLKNGEQPLFLDGFLTKVRNEYSGRYMTRVTIYLLTDNWLDWFRHNDGYLDRLIDKKRRRNKVSDN